MSGAFITIFVIIIFLNVISSASEKKLNKSAKAYRPKSGSSSGGTQNPWGNPDSSQSESPSRSRKTVSFKQGMKQAAVRDAKRRMEARIEDRRSDRATRRKDPADKNRRRSADWGERESRGALSLPNMLLLIAVAIILLYIFR